MTEYILISTAVAGLLLSVAFFLRSTREAREEYRGLGNAEAGFGDAGNEAGRPAPAAVSRIFSSEDQQFILSEASKDVSALFRRERKRLALRWIERQKREAAGTMRKHRDASRSAADLQPSSEVALFFRYVRLRLTFEFLAISVWLAGPQGLRGLAEQANAVYHGMQKMKALSDKRGVSG